MKTKTLFYLAGIFLLCACSQQKNQIMVIGHRGAMGYETENSLSSIQKALDLGVDMIEIDVFQIKSGEIVVFHDDDLGRLTHSAGKIEDLDMMQLEDIRLANGEKIPSLEAVLQLMDKKAKLNIELKGKNTAPAVSRIVKDYIANHGWQTDDFIISSFHWDALAAYRLLDQEIAIGVLTSKDPLDAIETARETQASAIHPNFKTLNQENVQQMQQAGFKVFTWTVNEPEAIANMKSLGVDGIITDYPDRVSK